MTKCECNVEAQHHPANECQRKAVQIATRNGVTILLCEECFFGSDKWVGKLEESLGAAQ